MPNSTSTGDGLTACPRCDGAGTLPGPAVCDACGGSGASVVHPSACSCMECDKAIFLAQPDARIRLSALDYIPVDMPPEQEPLDEDEERRREIGDECADDARRERGAASW